jgi:hypothetical protein
LFSLGLKGVGLFTNLGAINHTLVVKASNLHEKYAEITPKYYASVSVDDGPAMETGCKMGIPGGISIPTILLWHLVQDKKYWQRQDV